MEPVTVLASGRPQLLPNEVEVAILPVVEVDQLPKNKFVLRLTTHRIILQVP